MGVVDFDPEKWSRANASEALPLPAKVAELAEVQLGKRLNSQLSQLSQLDALPEALRDGLRRLRSMTPPTHVATSPWVEAVDAALRLAEDGWASQALALGWTPLDLFGASIDPDADPSCEGLVLWLRGRRLLAITDKVAIVEDGLRSRSYFYPSRPPGAKLLWEVARHEGRNR